MLLPAVLGTCPFLPRGRVTLLEIALPEIACSWGSKAVKRLIVYDLDGTLAPSKAALDAEMGALLHELLGIVRVAVISGGDWPQFEAQVLGHLPADQRLCELVAASNVWDEILPVRRAVARSCTQKT